MSRNPIELFTDLKHFLTVANELRESKSLSKVAEVTKTSKQNIINMLRRLEKHYNGVALVDRLAGSSKTKLSPFGTELLFKLEGILGFDINKKPRINIRLSYFVMQDKQLMLALRQSIQELVHSNFEFEFSCTFNFNDDEELEDLLTGRQDLIICWNFPYRLGKFSKVAGLKYEAITEEYPLMLVSHSNKVINDCSSLSENENGIYCSELKIERMQLYKIAMLNSHKQPLEEVFIKSGIYFSSKHIQQAPSFSAILELVKARIADVAIVPLSRSNITLIKFVKELQYRIIPKDIIENASSSLKIIGITRDQISSSNLHVEVNPSVSIMSANSRSVVCQELLNKISNRLNPSGLNPDTVTGPYHLSVNSISLKHIENIDRLLSKIKYGYYLFGSDEDSKIDTRWYLQKVKVYREGDGFKGDVSENERGVDYVITEARFLDGAFYLTAYEKKSEKKHNPNKGFISVFGAQVVSLNIAKEILHGVTFPAIIVGTWHGAGGRKKPISLWATVFSEIQLSEVILEAIISEYASTFNLTSSNR